MLSEIDSTTTTKERISLMNPMPRSARIAESAADVASGELDQPYTMGRHPSVSAPFPFTPREFARLLVLRGRVQDGLVAAED